MFSFKIIEVCIYAGHSFSSIVISMLGMQVCSHVYKHWNTTKFVIFNLYSYLVYHKSQKYFRYGRYHGCYKNKISVFDSYLDRFFNVLLKMFQCSFNRYTYVQRTEVNIFWHFEIACCSIPFFNQTTNKPLEKYYIEALGFQTSEISAYEDNDIVITS